MLSLSKRARQISSRTAPGRRKAAARSFLVRPFRKISIQRKLTLIIMAASTVALLLLSAGFVAYEMITFRQSMIRDLATLGGIIGNQSTAALAYDDQPAAEEILGALRAKERIVAACIYKANEPFAQYPAERTDGGLSPAHPGLTGPRFERDALVLFQPIKLDGETIGTLYLKSDLADLKERLRRYAGLTVVFMVVSWAVTYFLSSFLQRIVSRPILSLAET